MHMYLARLFSQFSGEKLLHSLLKIPKSQIGSLFELQAILETLEQLRRSFCGLSWC